MKVVVLTGAGISAESGVPTFRDGNGLWEGHRIEDVACPEAFARQPDVVHRFYDARRQALGTVEPNEAHRALAELEQHLGDDLLVVTQNVDDLHERAGSRRVVHMHGELRSALCPLCGNRMPWHSDLAHGQYCPQCHAAKLRPDIVWFGEVPYRLPDIDAALSRADVFAAIGTSGVVFPAAGFVRVARMLGAHTVELNVGHSSATELFDESYLGPATQTVPQWVTGLVGARAAAR